MKYAFAVVVFIAFVLPVYGQDKSPHTASHKERADKPAQSAPEPPPQAVNVINEQTSPPEKDRTKEHSEGYFRRLLAPENVPNIVLALVGITGIIIAICTLKTIERQTEAIETQAKAMMDADAAFLIVVWENLVHLNPETREQGKLGHALNWTVKNIGKTPAFIKEVACRFILISSLGDLPLEPQYPSPRDLQTEIEPLLAGGTLERWIYATLETTLSFDEVDKKVRKKESLLYGFGYVKYLDIYGREQETRFGLVYECRPVLTMAEDRLVMAGPKSYNRYAAFQKKK